MKKRLLAITLCLFFASSCASDVTHMTSSSPLSQSVSSETSSLKSDTYFVENDNYIATTRSGVARLYCEGKISETIFDLICEMLNNSDANFDLLISDFKLVYNEEKYNIDSKLEFDFTVKSSDLEYLPVGEYKKDLYDNRYTTMLDRGKDTFNIQNSSELSNIESVKRLKAWFMATYSMYTPNSESQFNNYDSCLRFICDYYANGEMPFSEFQVYAEKDFGIKPYAPEPSELGPLKYTADNGTEMVMSGGMGGGISYEIMDYEETDAENIVTVQHFPDETHILPSCLMRYKFGKNGEFLGYENVKYTERVSREMLSTNLPNTSGFKSVSFEELLAERPYMAALAVCDTDIIAQHPSNTYTKEMLDAADTFKVNKVNSILLDEYMESAVVSLDISLSDNFNFMRSDNLQCVIYDAMGYSIKSIATVDTPVTQLEKMLREYFSSMYAADLTKPDSEFSDGVATYALSRLTKLYPESDGFTENEIRDYAKKYLDAENFIMPIEFIKENDKYKIPGRGGSYTEYHILLNEGSAEFPEVTVQFYADQSRLVRSHQMYYSLQLVDGEYKIVNKEVLNKSQFEQFKRAV